MASKILSSEQSRDAGLLALKRWSQPIRNPSVFQDQLEAIYRVTRDWSSFGRWFQTNSVDPYLIDANMREAYQWFAGYHNQPPALRIWWHIVGSSAMAINWDFNTLGDPSREKIAGDWLLAIAHSNDYKHASILQAWCHQHVWMHDILVADSLDRNDASWLSLIQMCQPQLGPQSLRSLVRLLDLAHSRHSTHPIYHTNLCAEVHTAMENVVLHYVHDAARLTYYLDLLQLMAPVAPDLSWVVETVMLERHRALKNPFSIELPKDWAGN